MTDSRWCQEDGWMKKYWDHDGVHVHFLVQKINGIIVAIDDFKFKDKF